MILLILIGSSFFFFYLKPYGKSFLFNCNFHTNDIHVSNAFIFDVCNAWSQYNYNVPSRNFTHEIIWNNSNIKIDNKILFLPFFFKKNIILISDLLDDQHNFLNYNQLITKYSFHHFPFTLLNCLISAIPRTSFYVMKERHGTGRDNQTKHQQKLNNLKPKYRINHKGNLKMLPYKKTQKKANIQKKPKKSLKRNNSLRSLQNTLPKMQY